MILTKRQVEIFSVFYTNIDELITLQSVADEFNVTVRTIQNDLNVIREQTKEYGIEILSYPSKGCILSITDKESSAIFIRELQSHFDETNKFFDRTSRVDFLLSYLINKNDYVKSSDIADMLYISQSSVSGDLQVLREILDKYDLKLISKPTYGIKVTGSEINKRFCLIKERIISNPLSEIDGSHEVSSNKDLQVIGDILLNVFLEHKYRISEVVLQNLIIHVQVAINRIKKGYSLELENKEKIRKQFSHIEEMAREIFIQCANEFEFDVSDDEIVYLAINIHGKKEYDSDDFISSQTSSLIFEALHQLSRQYNIDLANDLELRIALALHVTPLMTRVKNNMQFTKLSKVNLKQSFPLAYNIANDFAAKIFKDQVLTDDEVWYLAVHFISALEEKLSNTGTTDILIISQHRQSDLFLMKQKIFRSSVSINKIDIIKEADFETINSDNYGVILTTEDRSVELDSRIRLVNFFIEDIDIKKIDYALRGLHNIDYIVSKFHKDLFTQGTYRSKREVTRDLIDQIHEHFGKNEAFEESVLLHEKNSPSSYFGNGIAIIHPEEPVSKETFIATRILESPLLWDEENEVNIVLLVSIEKGNTNAFKLWNIIPELISNEEFHDIHKKNVEFDEFINLVEEVYSNLF